MIPDVFTEIDERTEERSQQPTDLIAAEDMPISDLREFGQGGQIIDNFNGDKRECWAMASRVMGADCRNIRDHLDQPIPLRHWMIKKGPIRTRDGESKIVNHVFLIDITGQAYHCVSDGVYRGLEYLVQQEGWEPFEPPVMVVVRLKTLNNGNPFFVLEAAPEKYQPKGQDDGT
jgi:hypothetical protein